MTDDSNRQSRPAVLSRERDVIDVNRRWSVWIGTRRHGYNVGTVVAATRSIALRAARDITTAPSFFVVDEAVESAGVSA